MSRIFKTQSKHFVFSSQIYQWKSDRIDKVELRTLNEKASIDINLTNTNKQLKSF